MQYNYLEDKGWGAYFAPGEMAERSNAAVLKTVEAQVSGGSNPSLSAKIYLPAFNKKQVFYALLYKSSFFDDQYSKQ